MNKPDSNQQNQDGSKLSRPVGPERLTDDLFNFAAKYPGVAGHKVDGTSAKAAEAIEPFAQTLRRRVARHMAEIYPQGETADEAAHALGTSILATRPRFSELRLAGLIEKTGARRTNAESGLSANVWRATELLRSSVEARS